MKQRERISPASGKRTSGLRVFLLLVHLWTWRRIAKYNTQYRLSSRAERCCALLVGASLAVISHVANQFKDRLRTILSYDRILVLDSGKIAVS
jgi:hypothetical protein